MKNVSTIVLLLISARVFCQVGGVSISPEGNAPAPTAGLDINFINKGLLIPRLSTAQIAAIESPAPYLMVVDTTLNCVEIYGFGNWQTVSCMCTGAPSAPGTISGNASPCSNANNAVYTAVPVSGATSYTWTVPAGAAIIAGQGTSSITVDFDTSAGNISVTATNSCGTSSAAVFPITISTVPATPGTIVGNAYPCVNSTAQTYLVPGVNGASSYTWSVPSGSIVTAGQGTTSVLVNFATTPGSLAVTANNVCGASSASVLPIAMAITPSTPGTISGHDTFTTNQSGVIYSINPVTEATTYTWTVSTASSITSGQGTDSISVTFGDNGNICVTADNCAGTSSPNCLAVTNSCYTSGNITYTYTGQQQIFTVPCGVTSVTLAAYGAAGVNNGGLGGLAQGVLSVTPGSYLYVYVGGQSGFNGGGAGGNGSNAGDMSDVRVGGTAFTNAVIVGGGGGGGFSAYPGGPGGGGESCVNGAGGGAGQALINGNTTNSGPGYIGTCTSGGNGGNGSSGYAGGGGGGGLTSGGGGGSSGGYGANGGTGSFGQGGAYGNNCGNGGGGGGGGYYGGGGGANGDCEAGAGGGGSSWAAASITQATFTGGVQSGNGQVVITW